MTTSTPPITNVSEFRFMFGKKWESQVGSVNDAALPQRAFVARDRNVSTIRFRSGSFFGSHAQVAQQIRADFILQIHDEHILRVGREQNVFARLRRGAAKCL